MESTIWSHCINPPWITPKPDTKSAKSHKFPRLISSLIPTRGPPSYRPLCRAAPGRAPCLFLSKNIKKDSSLTNLLEHSFFHLDVCLNIQKSLSSRAVYTDVSFLPKCFCACSSLKTEQLWSKGDKNSSEIKETDRILYCIMHYKRAAVHPLPSWHLIL